MKSERFALLVVLLILVGMPVGLLGYQYLLRPALSPCAQTIDLTARLPGEGSWSQDLIQVRAGECILLRLTSDDVMHGFAIGQTEIGPFDVKPGEVVEIEFVIDQPGTYQFYCTRWCERDHWRMRGSIEVVDAQGNLPLPTAAPAPYILAGFNLDAPRLAAFYPQFRPSAGAGAALSVSLPSGWDTAYMTPEEAFLTLRADPFYEALSDADLWNLVAWAWRQSTDTQSLAAGQSLFEANCIACHGLTGGGDGPAARYYDDPSPANFTDPEQMAGVNGLILHGKIVRGGMGTNMPYWGPIFTIGEQWSLVDYLWSLWFDYGTP